LESIEVTLLARHINKSFQGLQALKNVSFELRRGEVHALIGENGAGKSTLMKILLSIYKLDSGEIIYKDKAVHFKDPHDALSHGISMIHQEISLIPTMSVAENVWIGREKNFLRFGLLDNAKRNETTQKLLHDIGVNLSPTAIVSSLSVANMQLVEIVRAISYNSDVVIMDEPTSALTESEIELLYTIIKDLALKGVSVVFISHKLEEIFKICDRVTILRDGEYIATHKCSEITMPELIRLIVGRSLDDLFPKLPAKISDPVLEVQNLCGDSFSNVSFTVHKGEILGFCGLMGAGRTEIMRAIFGIDRIHSGNILLFNKPVKIPSPKAAIGNGIIMLTEDRLRLGAIYALSVKKNVSLAYLRSIIKFLCFVKDNDEGRDAQEIVKRLDIKVSSINQRINLLSGGNQQKVILGRCLLTKPKLLILDEPTRGIDVGSKSEIHRMISQLAQEGLAIILISSELPEVIGMSDRILVVREGKIVFETTHEKATQEELISHSFGNFKEI
jgi:ABC-type sugar transport system ATPase subunit